MFVGEKGEEQEGGANMHIALAYNHKKIDILYQTNKYLSYIQKRTNQRGV